MIPLYVALDVEEEESALDIARKLAGHVEGFKIGPKIFFKSSKGFILKLKNYGQILLDFKFFDIPTSLVGAARSAFSLGVDSITVHASAGRDALTQLAELEAKLTAKRAFRVLAVTILTSFSQKGLPYFSKAYGIFSQVESLADLTVRSGLSGIVCSGEELIHLRRRHPEAYLLVPGVRLLQQMDEDQKRVCTPQQVLKRGANAFVMGRPIYTAKDPLAICMRIQNMC